MSRIGKVAIRPVAVLLCVLGIVFSFAARADEVTFGNKGKVSGTVTEVVFRLDGKIVKYTRQDILMFYFSSTGPDSLTLTAGKKKVAGTVVTVVLKTDRGKMRLKGAGIMDIELESDPLMEARRSILTGRRAKIAPDDAKGLMALAKWAREQGLAAEAEELAQAAIKADFKSDAAAEAHAFLGHVLYEGEWMSKAEMEKRKGAEKDPPADTAAKEKKNAAKVAKANAAEDAADNAKLKAAEDMATPTEKNGKACTVFFAKIARSRQRQLNSVNGVYNVTRKRLTAQIAKAQATISKINSEQGSAGGYTSVHVRDSSGGTARSKGNAARAQAQATVSKLKTKRARLAIAKRRKVARITKLTARRKKRVLAVKAEINKKIAAGEKITLSQMISSYKKAMQ